MALCVILIFGFKNLSRFETSSFELHKYFFIIITMRGAGAGAVRKKNLKSIL